MDDVMILFSRYFLDLPIFRRILWVEPFRFNVEVVFLPILYGSAVRNTPYLMLFSSLFSIVSPFSSPICLPLRQRSMSSASPQPCTKMHWLSE